MRNHVSVEPFAKFTNEYFQSKANKFKSSIIKGGNSLLAKSLQSRLIQVKDFKPPTLTQLSSIQWNEYLGRQLTRNQSKDLNLLGPVLPYSTEGQFELELTFESGQLAKRGNIILTHDIIKRPKVSFSRYPDFGKDGLSLLLFDCDHHSSESGKLDPFILWNISNFGTNNECEIIPYSPACPERGTGVHRIVGMLVKNLNANLSERSSSNLSEILANGAEVISYNFFLTFWTKSVSDYLKLANSEDRIFGCASSFIACVILQPLDVIKTQIQEQVVPYTLVAVKNRKLYSGIVSRIYSSSGSFGFWKGLTPTILRNVPGTGLYFIILESLRKSSSKSPMSNLAIGALARVFAGQILMPFTVIKVQMESSIFAKQSFGQAAYRILHGEGLKGFFKGSIPTALRDSPGAGVYYMVYQWTKGLFPVHIYTDYTDYFNVVASINAAICSSLATNPFDVIKTRAQLPSFQSKISWPNNGTWTVSPI